ncbi:MAG: hypothetical protein U9Q81_19790 [Pseudomonadota bacterium]|nr:hypothetical protein [Pseudomonadota bacterium]
MSAFIRDARLAAPVVLTGCIDEGARGLVRIEISQQHRRGRLRQHLGGM